MTEHSGTRLRFCASAGWLGALVSALVISGALTGCAGPAHVEPQPVPARQATAPAAAEPGGTGAGTASAVAPAPLPGPFDWRGAVLYFAIVDRFVDGDPSNDTKVDRAQKGTFHGGDLRGLAAHLDEIAGLGVNALWITPVVKNIDGFVTGAGFPDWAYHGYWADDFYKLDPRFGTEADLAALVAACHARGIRVLLDVVYNHAGYDSHYVTDPRTKNWMRTGSQCGQDDLTSCVSGLPDFKTEEPQVADYLMKAHLGLAKRVGLDGFRLDTVKHVDHPFWDEHRKRTRAELGKDFFLVGEVWGGQQDSLAPWFDTDEMDAGFDFSFQGSTLGFVMGRGRAIAYDRYLKSREKVKAGHELAHFLSSHDVPGALFQLQGNKELFRLAAVLQMTVSGIPVIYYGEEVGRPGGDWPDNRSDMPWGDRKLLPGAGQPRDEALRALYTKLIAIRRAHPALTRGTHEALSTEGDLYVFARHDAEAKDAIVVAVNRGDAPLTAHVTAPSEWGGAAPKELLGGNPPTGTATLDITVAPHTAQVLGLE